MDLLWFIWILERPICRLDPSGPWHTSELHLMRARFDQLTAEGRLCCVESRRPRPAASAAGGSQK
jgi:hypothetical protein